MERRPGLWVATTPVRQWQVQRRALVTRSTRNIHLRLGTSVDQTWRGFGGCFNEMGWMALSALRGVDRNRVMDSLFEPRNGCGFNFCRVPIGASDYSAGWYSLNDTAGDLSMRAFSVERDRKCLIPFIRMALQRRPRMKLFASPWSPPQWMKEPTEYHGGHLDWRPQILEAYALYLARFLQAYQKEGIKINQLHVQNEPVTGGDFPSCLWSGGQMRDFIRGYLAPMLVRQRIKTELWLGTLNTDDYNSYPLNILTDPMVRKYISGVSFQGAGKAIVQKAHVSWPDMPLVQAASEGGDGKNSWEHARHVFGLLQHYISGGACAYAYGNMVLPQDGMSTWGHSRNSMVSVDMERKTFRLNPEYYVMKHFSHFIETYSMRLNLSGEWSGNAVLFSNDDDTRTLVIQNPFQSARRIVIAEGRRMMTLNLQSESVNTLIFGGGAL